MTRMSRRTFLRTGVGAGAAAAVPGASWGRASADREFALDEMSIDELQVHMSSGRFRAVDLVRMYLARIEDLNLQGPELRAVIEVNPDAEGIAAAMDAERRAGRIRGPLHGIPVLLKDNIDTADRMRTTAGSLALAGSRPRQDAGVAERLRRAGAVLLGKTNLSEWANIRSSRSSSGWSARGRQCRNPYVLTRTPCGSSSGSAVAVAANLCAVAIGTETDGSIVCPSHINGIVGLKPTVGLVSRAGVVPISHSQDTVGPHARSVRDAALVLTALAGTDPRDEATRAIPASVAGQDLARACVPGGLRGARIGVPRKGGFLGYSSETDRVVEEAIRLLREQGAIVIDPADIPNIDRLNAENAELDVLLYELKHDLEVYLAGRTMEDPSAPPMRTLADVIAFNENHRDLEMPYFGQELFEQAVAKGPLTDPAYSDALAKNLRLAREEGLDAVFAEHRLDALVAGTGGPAWPIDLINGDHFMGGSSSVSAMAGYPLLNVPAGDARGLPIGITFMGRPFAEGTLIRIGHAFEVAAQKRARPRFLRDLDLP